MKAKVIGKTIYDNVKKNDVATIKNIIAIGMKFAAEVLTEDNRTDIVYFDDLEPVYEAEDEETCGYNCIDCVQYYKCTDEAKLDEETREFWISQRE